MKSKHFAPYKPGIIERGLQDFTSAQIAIFKNTFSKIYSRQISSAKITMDEPASFKVAGRKNAFFFDQQICM
jgi:hypothetical protein